MYVTRLLLCITLVCKFYLMLLFSMLHYCYLMFIYFVSYKIVTSCYQARAKRGLFTNWEDTIPGPSDSIGASKMYILEKGILGNKVLMLRFLCFLFFTALTKNGKKRSKVQKTPKNIKTFFLLSTHISYKDKSLGKIPFLKKLTMWFT